MRRGLKIGLGAAAMLLVGLPLAGWLALRAPDLPFETLEKRFADSASRYADLGGGVRVHYREWGDPTAPVVILVHGFGDNSFSWDGWAERLATRYRVIAPDMPGHGLTRTPERYAAASARFPDIVHALAGKLDIDRFAIAGNSMGGGVAWAYAAAHPERVSALILVDAAGWREDIFKGKPPLAFQILRYQWGRDLLASIDTTPLIRQGLAMDVVDQSVITEAFVERWAAFQRAPGHRPLLMALPASPGSAADVETLGRIAAPTLVQWGEQDKLINVASAGRFARAIPNARTIIYPDLGHLPQVEAPARTADDAGAFLDEHLLR